jgi:predicted ABC-type ATPase
MDKPQLFIFAGPNGAGKSTISRLVLGDEVDVFDGDLLQKQLETEQPDLSWQKMYEITSGIFREKQDNAILNREDFAYETNFTFEQSIRIPEKFRAAGYEITMFYVGLGTIEESTDRVNLRKKEGGHDVDAASIEMNFNGGIENIKSFFSFFDRLFFIENPIINPPRIVLHAQSGRIIRQSENLPEWVKNHFSEIL